MPFASALLDFMFPPVCLACDAVISPGDPVRLICGRCRARLPAVPGPGCPRCAAPRLVTGRFQDLLSCRECAGWPPRLRARSACLLLPPADRVVHQLKYRGWHALARPMAERMARLSLPEDAARARRVVPVPTTAARLRTRGYNQAELLAGAFARLTGRQLFRALERGAASSSQTALQPAERGANVTGAFRCVSSAGRGLQGAHVLLVDDVLTTGATAAECTRVLEQAGALAVTLVTFARAPTVRAVPT